MELREYLQKKTNGRKIILTDKISLANSLMRKLNITEGIDIFDAEPATIRDICTEIVTAYDVILSDKRRDLLTPEAEVYLMEGVLRRGRYKTISVNSISVSTARDVLECVSELCMNTTTDEWDACTDDKAHDIKIIIEEYRNKLEEKNVLDLASMIGETIRILKSLPAGCEGVDITPEYLIPRLSNACIGILSTYGLSSKERELVNVIREKIPGVSVETIDVFTEAGNVSELFGSGLHADVKKAYGVANEVEYTASTIVHDDADFGNVQVFYSDRSYLNYIKASFDRMHIPYVITNGYSAKELNLTQFMLDIIASAREDFSYELLKEAMINPVVTFKNVTKERSDSVYVNPIKAYNDVLNEGIGWGRARYDAYKKRAEVERDKICSDPEESDRHKDIARGHVIFSEFLEEYCKVFGDADRTGEILVKLWRFARRYTYSPNRDIGKLQDSVYQAIEDLKYLDDEDMTKDDKLDNLTRIIEDIKVNDDPDPSAVSVSFLQGIQVIERSRVFMLGLGVAGFNMDTKQSPILLDDEKVMFIEGAGEEGSPITLASQRNMLRRQDAFATLSTMGNGRITFLYNYFDTVGLKASSPSVFFLEIMDILKVTDAEPVEGYETVRDDIRIDPNRMRDLLKKHGDELKVRKAAEKEEKARRRKEHYENYLAMIGSGMDEDEAFDIEYADEEIRSDVFVPDDTEDAKEKSEETRIVMSATGLQTFLSCPLKYYYNYINYLKVYEQKSQSGYSWLGNFGKGNLFHYTAEEYFNNVDPLNGWDEKKNAAILLDIVNKQADIIELTEPYISLAMRNKEVREYYDKMLDYIRYTTLHWTDEREWRVAGCEVGFENIDYDGTDSGHPVKLSFRGSIDRMDVCLEENTLHVRIVDYKTGKIGNKEKEVDAGVQVQHFIYAMGAIEYFKSDDGQKRINNLYGRKIDEYSIDYIGYEFPYDTEENYSLDTTDVVRNTEGNVLTGRLDSLRVRLTPPNEKDMDDLIGAYQSGALNGIPERCDEMIQRHINDEREKILASKNEAAMNKAQASYDKRKADYDRIIEENKVREQAGKRLLKVPDEPKFEKPQLLQITDVEDGYDMQQHCMYCDYFDVCRYYVGGSRS